MDRRPSLPSLAEFYVELLRAMPGPLTQEKIERALQQGDDIINRGLRDGKTFEEIRDLQETHRMVLEELEKHPQLEEEWDEVFQLITHVIKKRFDGPWGRLLV